MMGSAQQFGGEKKGGFDCPCPRPVGAIAAQLCKTHPYVGWAGVKAIWDLDPSPRAIAAQCHASLHEEMGIFLRMYVSAVLYVPTKGVSTENL